MKLTDASVKSLKPIDKRQEIPDALCVGLYLTVQTTGSKAWQVRYRMAGVHRRMTLGPYPLVSLAEARDRARTALLAASNGEDPAELAKAKKAVPVEIADDRDKVKTVIADFLKRHAAQNRRADDVAAMFRREILPKWGERPIQEVTKRDLVDLLDAIVDRGSPITANRLLAHVRTVWTWAVGRDIIEASPFGSIKPPSKEKPRDRVLTDQEIAWFWDATGLMGQPFGSLQRLLLLTGQRLREVAEMTEGEVAGDLWTIPGARAKNGDQHTVPLSKVAVSVLDSVVQMQGKAGFVFSTTGESAVSGFTRAKSRLDHLMNEAANKGRAATEDPIVIPAFTIHDLRRTCASGMAGLGFPPHVVEAVLNHRSGTRRGVAGVYNRYDLADEKRQALEAWGRFVTDLSAGKRGNVVQMRTVGNQAKK